MNFRERMIAAAQKALKESVDSSAEMIADNIVPSFENMGMATVKPGEFAQEEITDQENLINKANMSNDNNFNKDNCECNAACVADEMINNMLDISGRDDDDVETQIEITAITDDEDEDDHYGHHHHDEFGESVMAKALKKALNGKTIEQYLVEATDYAGPLDFIPDTRINVSDVLQTLKNEIGEGSEGIHVDQLYDERKNNCYKVSQVDKNKLPKNLVVANLKLKLDDDTYKIDGKADNFPVAK